MPSTAPIESKASSVPSTGNSCSTPANALPSRRGRRAEWQPTAAGVAILRAMYGRMVEAYGPQQWWPAETALEVIVGAYLTQNTAWRSVERSIENLRTHRLLTVDALHRIAEDELRILIRPSGYMVRKAAAIKAFVRFLIDTYAGSLDRLSAVPTSALREQLLALPGVGPETADAILLYALGHSVMVVDEYLRRIAIRHGLAPSDARYGELQRLACGAFEGEDASAQRRHFNEFHALIVMVGKQHCGPKPRCAGCPVASFPAPIRGSTGEPCPGTKDQKQNHPKQIKRGAVERSR